MANVQLEQIPLDDARLKEFVRVPWKLYRGDPCWTPPLTGDLLGNKLLGTKGLLTSEHPYHETADVTHFIAKRDGESVGRISAAVNYRYNDYHGTKIGNFGFFETVDDYAVAELLLDAAKKWVVERGMEVLRGPGEYSNATHERQGLLVEGFEYPPTVELTHNPPFYQDFVERYGFHKAMDYYAYRTNLKGLRVDRAARLAKRVVDRHDVVVRRADLKRLDEEIQLLADIYNDAWSENWGFLPLTEEEGKILADALRPVLDPNLLLFLYIDGKEAAVFGGLPDLYVPLRPRWRWPLDTELVRMVRTLIQGSRIRSRLRLFFFGLRKEFRGTGAEAVLYSQLCDYALAKGYELLEGSLMLENNDKVLTITSRFGGERYKTWRIYDLDL